MNCNSEMFAKKLRRNRYVFLLLNLSITVQFVRRKTDEKILSHGATMVFILNRWLLNYYAHV